MYKPDTPVGRSNFYDFYSAARVSEVERRRGDISLSESGQLSIHEKMPYVVLRCSLLPTHPIPDQQTWLAC
jgi:hypothetical protein